MPWNSPAWSAITPSAGESSVLMVIIRSVWWSKASPTVPAVLSPPERKSANCQRFSATVRIGRTGKISVFTGANAIGQGIKSALTQICADQFGVDPRSIHIVAGDTDTVPTGLGAFASRQTVMAGSAVHIAAKAVRQKTLEVAAEMLEAAVADLEMRDGRVEVKGVPGHGLSLRQIGETMAGVPGYNLPACLWHTVPA